MLQRINQNKKLFWLTPLISSLVLFSAHGTKTDESLIKKAEQWSEVHSLPYYQWIDIIETIKKDPAKALEKTPSKWTLLHEYVSQAIPSPKSKEGKILIQEMTGKFDSGSPLPQEKRLIKKPSIEEATQHLNKISASSIITLLVQSGLPIDSKTDDGSTALFIATRFDFSGDIIKELLAQHASLTEKDKHQQTALHNAAQNNNKIAVELLLNEAKKQNLAHILVSAKDTLGRTAYHFAAQNKTPDIAKALSRAGASLQAQDNKGATPLHYAADKGNSDVVSFLLKNGASAKAQNNEGKTAAHFAANKSPAIQESKVYMREKWTTVKAPEHDHLACINALYKKDKSSIFIPDFSGKTPLDYAILKNNKEVVSFIQTHK